MELPPLVVLPFLEDRRLSAEEKDRRIMDALGDGVVLSLEDRPRLLENYESGHYSLAALRAELDILAGLSVGTRGRLNEVLKEITASNMPTSVLDHSEEGEDSEATQRGV
ncbi:MAG: hypothetical protein Q8O95_05500 [bacterium]|nr:hypothetical protein [bacterium]